MEDKKELELVQETREKKKADWTPKKVITTIIIAILALLMVGGLSYVIILVQQDTDERNIFGKYNGEPIKYEANSVFYNTLNSNPDYAAALEKNDINGIYSSWYQAYQSQVLFTALSQAAEKAGIKSPEKLVDQLIISSGIYASEDGSKSFDEDVYNSRLAVERSSTYSYYQKLFPYYTVVGDYQTVLSSDNEKNFVSNLTKKTRSFEYYVIDCNAYPDLMAREYDISGMTLATDSEGKPVEPALPEIKAYIYSKDAEEVKPYIETAKEVAEVADFYSAAEMYGNGVNKVSKALNNVGGSSYMFADIRNRDEKGYLAKAFNEALAKELYTAEVGYVTSPIATDYGYLVVRVASEDTDESSTSLVDLMYDYYSASQAMNSLASAVLTSDGFKDEFMVKFMPLIMGQMTGAQQ